MNREIAVRVAAKSNHWDEYPKGIWLVSTNVFTIGDFIDGHVDLDFKGGGSLPVNDIEWSSDEVKYLQCAGLKDKNGVDIYDGSIIRVRTVRVSGGDSNWYQSKNINHKHVEIECFVIWSERDLGWRLRLCKRNQVKELQRPMGRERIEQWVHVPYTLTDRDCCANGEVVGNIYENPELIHER